LVGGIILTLITGLFISFFIGDSIIISGINQEKRIDEKTEEEINNKIENTIIPYKRVYEQNLNYTLNKISKEQNLYYECQRCYFKINKLSNMKTHLNRKIKCDPVLSSLKYTVFATQKIPRSLGMLF
jgi:hypothetical protein